MQQTKTITDERPRRAEQVVPREPSVRHRYYILIYGITMLLLIITIGAISWNVIPGNGSLQAFPLFWKYSFLGDMALSGAIFSVVYVSPLSLWRALDKRRQQAARYNLTVGAWERAIVHHQADVPALPDSFTVSSQRSWPGTCISTIFCLFLLGMIGASAYYAWQGTFPLIQQGVPMALVILNTCINLALFCCVAAYFFIALVFAPKQQLIVTREGLTCRQGYRKRFIPWQQACLFALIGQARSTRGQPLFFYELASKDTIIRWPSTNGRVGQGFFTKLPGSVALLNNAPPVSSSTASPFPQQIQFLNIIVAERTGLSLYDLC